MDPRPLDRATVLQAITVFGARIRGVPVDDDTGELAAELQRRWQEEGHAPAPAFPSGSRRARALHLARRGASRLPEPWKGRIRRAVAALRARAPR